MQIKNIEKAVKEAREFIKRAEIVLEQYKENKLIIITGNKNTGALRRQSLELTNALVDMRQS